MQGLFNLVKTGTLILFLGLIFFVFPQSKANGAELSQILESMQKKYQTIDSMVCTFDQTFVHKESGSSETRRGELHFKKPLLVRWDVSGKDRELLVITKKEIWDYLVDEDLAYRYSLELVNDSNSFIKVVTGQANVREDFEVELAGESGGLATLHLYPKNPTQQLTEAYFWVDLDSGVIQKVKVIDFFGNANEVAFIKIDLNVKVADSQFSFTPPSGVEVEDRIENPQSPEKDLFQ